jgi:hypothetical protein
MRLRRSDEAKVTTGRDCSLSPAKGNDRRDCRGLIHNPVGWLFRGSVRSFRVSVPLFRVSVPLFRVSVPFIPSIGTVIPSIGTVYSEYRYRLFRVSVRFIPSIGTVYSEYRYSHNRHPPRHWATRGPTHRPTRAPLTN